MKMVWLILQFLSAIWWTSCGISMFAFVVWLFQQPKFEARSRWGWWTPSGMLSRAISILATKWAQTPNELWPFAVFAYGVSELYGFTHGTKLLLRFHAKHISKRRKQHGNTTT
jgi:hypothetical protein